MHGVLLSFAASGYNALSGKHVDDETIFVSSSIRCMPIGSSIPAIDFVDIGRDENEVM